MIKVSCIIPAYNEGPRLEKVINVAISHKLIDEVIVINDASTDNTQEVIGRFPTIRFIEHSNNKGKSQSIYDGLKLALGEIIIMLDADLIGLTANNLDLLLEPVLNDKADISVSLRINSPKIWRIIGLDFISGERVFPKQLIDSQIDKIPYLPKFGLEVFLNNIIIKHRYRLKIVNWPNVISPFKYKKHGLWSGFIGEIKMIADIFKTISPITYVWQIFMMLRLKI